MQAAATKATPFLHPTKASFRSFRRSLSPKLKIGFVPTMGALHDGHLSLVKEARQNNDIVVASIFVNPTQFIQGEDFDKYPRQLERDSELLGDYGVDHLFAPAIDDMYGKNHVTYIQPEGFDDIPEGIIRPGHFRGVATIVTKLFNIVQPTNAYFGQKDAAQCCLIKRIVEDLDMDLTVQVMDTIREDDGLAMSSRNAYLTKEERQAAPVLYKSLLAASELYSNNNKQQKSNTTGNDDDDGILSASDIKSTVTSILSNEKLVSDIQYVSIDNKETMQPISHVGKDGAVISIGCKVGSVRLIDNIVL